MVQYGARLSYWREVMAGSAEFAILRGDVVETGESHVETESLSARIQPEIAEPAILRRLCFG